MIIKNDSNYLYSLIIMRGIVSVCVFGFHLFLLTNKYYENEFLLNFFMDLRSGLSLFFIISGIVITHSLINSKYEIKFFPKYVLKRLVRIHPTYLVVLFLGILYAVLRNVFVSDLPMFSGINGYQILAHIFYVIDFTDYYWINIVFWTLAIDFQFYIFYALLFPLILKYRFILLLLMVPSIFLWNIPETALQHFAVFTIGIVIALFYNKKIQLKEFLFFVLVASAVVIYVNGMPVFLFTLFIYPFVFYKQKLPNKVFLFLGQISYSLFLIHTITASLVINFAHRFPKTPVNKVMFTLLAVLVTFFAAYLLFKFVEQPTARLSKKIVYRDKFAQKDNPIISNMEVK